MSGRALTRSDLVVIGGSGAAVAAAAATRYANVDEVIAFAVAALAVALLASLVGRSVDQLGDRFGAGATGVLQSALGNLPELFIGFFAIQAGLVAVVQAAIIGSILANILLVLGLAFTVGGLRHGTQHFDHSRARTTAVLMVLATAALVLPSVAAYVHTPAESHETQLSVIVSVVLLTVFVLSLPAALRRHPNPGPPAAPAGTARSAAGAVAVAPDPATGIPDPVPAGPQPVVVRPDPVAENPAAGLTGEPPAARPRWPLWLALTMLALSAVAAAFVSDWFVSALQPAMDALGISEAFAGLVVVAIASNAVENVVGVQLAGRNRADYAVSVIVNSPLQIALVLAPALVLLSFLTGTTLTLVFAPMLVVSVVLTVLAVSMIVYDGESNWLEGVTLMALYVIIATVFWWG